LEMPVMDGLETLVALRKIHPRLPVIMFSRHTQRGVEATVRALTLGADDYVPKPGDGLDVGLCIEELLIPKIKGLARRDGASVFAEEFAATRAGGTSASLRPASPSARVKQPQAMEIVVIGASTGGPNALAELFTAFGADWSIPIVLVQHMPPLFTARLAER